ELARKVQALHALTDLKRGITVNVGLVSGGQSVNTVAPWAQAQIDLRYVDPADRDELMGAIHAIADKSYVPGTSATLTIRGEFVPLKQNAGTDAVFALYKQVAEFETAGEFTGGCADSGFTALMGAPTLC